MKSRSAAHEAPDLRAAHRHTHHTHHTVHRAPRSRHRGRFAGARPHPLERTGRPASPPRIRFLGDHPAAFGSEQR